MFRLVDEWFIAMDPLRQPISEVTRQIRWLPEGIGLQERELDWLRNMGDWMISKKRYYGLALPIWVCSECEAWEVVGGKDELRERAVAGWEAFEGHTPHRPWVDAVEIACSACGGRSQRIADVGNPWLDAGIVGFSTLGWNEDRAYWREWFPADYVVESFPGQFRNWFYALLTMSTVLANEPMARTLFGYALVRDEHGDEMHKSKGNAIQFDEAAEQIGADVMRWMFMSANPAVNMNFGYHLAHEEVRRFFLPVWNAYSFFVTYARLDGWRPEGGAHGEHSARNLLDKWVLSRLDGTVDEVRAALDGYDAQRATRSVEGLVEDLSNWYIRRNRRRFWKGELDDDKRAAYDTLYEVLVTLTRLLAPFTPHLADAMWENLVTSVEAEAPDSVHLASFPEPQSSRRDTALEQAVARTRAVVALGHAARAQSGMKVRQPLPAVRVLRAGGGVLGDDHATEAELTEQVLEELNVKRLEVIPDASELVERTLRPLLPVLGPRRGAAVSGIMAAARSGDWRELDDGRVAAGGVVLEPDEFQLIARARAGHEVAEEGGLLVAVDTTLTPELEAEGFAREVAHRLQGLRKAAGYEISDRIEASISGDPDLLERLAPYQAWLAEEVLAPSLSLSSEADAPAADRTETVEFEGTSLTLAVRRAV